MPRQLRATKEGVKKTGECAESAGEIPTISRDEPKAKERSYFFSPTEKQQKSINPPELQKRSTHKKSGVPAEKAAAISQAARRE